MTFTFYSAVVGILKNVKRVTNNKKRELSAVGSFRKSFETFLGKERGRARCL